MEAVQVIQCILGLFTDYQGLYWQGSDSTHVHDVVKHHECCTTGLLLVADADLPYTAIPSEQVVQILSRDLVIQVLHKQYSVGPRR